MVQEKHGRVIKPFFNYQFQLCSLLQLPLAEPTCSTTMNLLKMPKVSDDTLQCPLEKPKWCSTMEPNIIITCVIRDPFDQRVPHPKCPIST
jgi:hypothetical protein